LGARLALLEFPSHHFLQMLATRTSIKVSAELFGRPAYVPDDPYIKMSHWFTCVAETDCPNSIPFYLRDWQTLVPNQRRSIESIREVIALADQHSPSRMHVSGFFISVPDETLPGTQNKWVRLTATSRELGVLALNSAAIAVVRNSARAVTVMLHRTSFEDESYYRPYQALSGTLSAMIEAENSRRRVEESARRPGVVYYREDPEPGCAGCNVY
jgi:hypothetical protein